ncbi:hypothetical protein PV327_010858 [Microctonus hyperodae]|uniref:Uncharacterized protein n=1 Tax=Microctonus hyperodae TaxID=165561 RepID=A0AA39EY76_MICHY|nr:hypothetical protein PV327_010858 [Microctonus hyperodae]
MNRLTSVPRTNNILAIAYERTLKTRGDLIPPLSMRTTENCGIRNAVATSKADNQAKSEEGMREPSSEKL